MKRFWGKVAMAGPDDCWLWQGSTNQRGYGTFWWDGLKLATRVAYKLWYGEPPIGLACHTCDTPLCCNPRHLYDGTYQQNTADRETRNRTARGSAYPNARFTEAQVASIKRRLADGEPNLSIAKEFKVDPSMISRIKTGKTWGHVSMEVHGG